MIRRAVSWWLERAADRRIAHARRIKRLLALKDVKISGAASEVDLDARHRFNCEVDAGENLRVAARILRQRAR